MKAKQLIFIVLALWMLMPLCSCKPTEKGYKQAYEIAKQKERQGLDDDVFEKMNEAAKPPMIEIDGVKMREKVQFMNLVYPDELAQHSQLQMYSPAVGSYKMLFNAKSHTDRLRADGLPALMVMNPEKVYFVCIGTFDTREEAAKASAEYIKNYPGQYVGMDEPLLLVKAR